MSLPLDDLGLLDEYVIVKAPVFGAPSGTPLPLSLDLIDEDPDQPRREFDAERLAQLAETIAQRGVRTPISVRPNPQQEGRWIVNMGARRIRASRIAGKTDIPAFVDAMVNSFDKVIENEQRDGLTPMELALFVQRQLHAGMTQADIAKQLGKSRAYVTYLCAMIDPPDWLHAVYRDGKCQGILELYELRKLHDKHPSELERWAGGRTSIARSDIDALRSQLEPKSTPESAAPALAERVVPVSTQSQAGQSVSALAGKPLDAQLSFPQFSESPKTVAAASARRPTSSVALLANCEGREVRVWLDRPTGQAGQVFVTRVGIDQPMATELHRLSSLRLVQIPK